MTFESNNIPADPTTYGEVAYNAYCNNSGWKSLATGADLPQFAATTPEIRAGWEAAAQATLEFYQHSQQTAPAPAPEPAAEAPAAPAEETPAQAEAA